VAWGRRKQRGPGEAAVSAGFLCVRRRVSGETRLRRVWQVSRAGATRERTGSKRLRRLIFCGQQRTTGEASSSKHD